MWKLFQYCFVCLFAFTQIPSALSPDFKDLSNQVPCFLSMLCISAISNSSSCFPSKWKYIYIYIQFYLWGEKGCSNYLRKMNGSNPSCVSNRGWYGPCSWSIGQILSSFTASLVLLFVFTWSWTQVTGENRKLFHLDFVRVCSCQKSTYSSFPSTDSISHADEELHKSLLVIFLIFRSFQFC